jgi:hypothetical protein
MSLMLTPFISLSGRNVAYPLLTSTVMAYLFLPFAHFYGHGLPISTLQ